MNATQLKKGGVESEPRWKYVKLGISWGESVETLVKRQVCWFILFQDQENAVFVKSIAQLPIPTVNVLVWSFCGSCDLLYVIYWCPIHTMLYPSSPLGSQKLASWIFILGKSLFQSINKQTTHVMMRSMYRNLGMYHMNFSLKKNMTSESVNLNE